MEGFSFMCQGDPGSPGPQGPPGEDGDKVSVCLEYFSHNTKTIKIDIKWTCLQLEVSVLLELRHFN